MSTYAKNATAGHATTPPGAPTASWTMPASRDFLAEFTAMTSFFLAPVRSTPMLDARRHGAGRGRRRLITGRTILLGKHVSWAEVSAPHPPFPGSAYSCRAKCRRRLLIGAPRPRAAAYAPSRQAVMPP